MRPARQMIRLLHVLSVLVILLAGGMLTLCVTQWAQDGPQHNPLLERSGAVEAFTQRTHETPSEEKERLSPLIAAASAFAGHLNPPAPPKIPPAVQEVPRPVAPVVRPPTASVKFKLCGTSCCDDRPEQSMALIWEPGSKEAARWVKKGTQVGHFIIQEIRPGSVVYRVGEQVQEMAIEPQAAGAAVTAEGGGSREPATPVPAKAEAARLPALTKRPTSGKGMTVGSARTAALN